MATCDKCGAPSVRAESTGVVDRETGYVDEVYVCAKFPDCDTETCENCGRELPLDEMVSTADNVWLCHPCDAECWD